ncbi:MAG TPA: DUF2339 domain-containing protein [Clostridiales bacterium]|nr:DUF2339 domain-containing protein [Clostridiales bacterium]
MIAILTLSTISTILYIGILDSYSLFSTNLQFTIFASICAIQLLVGLHFYKNIQEILIYYYVSIMSYATILFVNYTVGTNGGIVFVLLFLLIVERLFKIKEHKELITLLLIIDTIMCFGIYGNRFLVFIKVLQLVTIAYLLFYNNYKKDYKKNNFIKTSFVVIILINVSTLPWNICKIMDCKIKSVHLNTITHLLLTITFISFLLMGLFKKWDKNFDLLSNKKDLDDDKTIMPIYYFFSSFIYFMGLIYLRTIDSNIGRFIILLTTLSIALIQSAKLILNSKKNNNSISGLLGFWIGTKYLMFLWTALSAFTDSHVHTMYYTLTGLLIALIAIYIGFILKFKSLRLYGLVLTILMVVKFILIDLIGNNSITRVISLVIGGVICFGISVLYNQLNTEIKESEQETKKG